MDGLFSILFLTSFVCLLLGLVKPTMFSRFIKGEVTRKKTSTIFGIALIASLILLRTANVTSTDNQITQTPTQQPVIENQDSVPIEVRPPSTSFSNGTYIIGTDIKAGTYRSQGKNMCYWARQKGFSGELDDIIANGNNTPEIVTIDETDAAFQTSGCGQWLTIESTYPVTPATSFSDGTYEIGKHIEPGTYRAGGSPDDLCYWARLSDFYHSGVSGIIANGNSPTVISISASDKGFTTLGCGTWVTIQN